MCEVEYIHDIVRSKLITVPIAQNKQSKAHYLHHHQPHESYRLSPALGVEEPKEE